MAQLKKSPNFPHISIFGPASPRPLKNGPTSRALVTPDISGLSNPEAMSAAYDAGVRFVVSDTSRPGMDNPTPQAGRSSVVLARRRPRRKPRTYLMEPGPEYFAS